MVNINGIVFRGQGVFSFAIAFPDVWVAPVAIAYGVPGIYLALYGYIKRCG